MELQGSPDTGEVQSLKEEFAGPESLSQPGMSSVMEFIWWLTAKEYGHTTANQNGYPYTIRLTRAGKQFLDDKDPHAPNVPMGDDPTGHARSALWEKGWALPQAPVPFGVGGGGAVYKCYSREVIRVLSEYRGDFAGTDEVIETIGVLDQLVRLSPDRAYAALKIAKRNDPRFAREIVSMLKVEDPHLVRVLARDERTEPIWFLMEYFDGVLHEKLDEYRGEPVKVLRAVAPLARALGRLHDADVIHRDIKTKNIFRRANGELVLGDFGIVYDDTEEGLTSYESPRSPDWTPPWKPAELKLPARDVFALARVVYAMLTGNKFVQPHWLNEESHSLAGLFPDQAAIMRHVDEFLRRHIVKSVAECGSADGHAMANALDELVECLMSPASEILFRWGAGLTEPKSAANRSLIETLVCVPSWAKRLSARARTHGSGDVQFRFAIRRTQGSQPADVAVKSSETMKLVPRVWSEEVSIDVGPADHGWRYLTVDGHLQGLIADVLIVAWPR